MSNYVFLGKAVLSGNAGSISITGIDQSYNHLRVVGNYKADRNMGIFFRFNNDTSSSYKAVGARSRNSSEDPVGWEFASNSYFTIADNDSALDEAWGGFVWDIFDYSQTNYNKSFSAQTSMMTLSSTCHTSYSVGMWQSNNAINRIDLLNSEVYGGVWRAGTEIRIYGVIG